MGRALTEAAVKDALKRGARYPFVATLHPDDPYEPHLGDTTFYEAMGFVYIDDEQFPADPEKPMAHYLPASRLHISCHESTVTTYGCFFRASSSHRLDLTGSAL